MKYLKLIYYSAIALVILSSCGGNEVPVVKLYPVESSSGEYQYIDENGRIAINPQFRQATVFREGMALVQTGGNDPKWGYISPDGNFAIIPQYNTATVFSEGLAWVMLDSEHPFTIDKRGRTAFTLYDALEVNIFQEGLAAYSIISDIGEELWGFIDKTGQVIITPQFAKVMGFRNGSCAVMNQEGKWGYIDKNGKITINYQFDYAYGFEKGRAIVLSNDNFGVINKDGRYTINPQFSAMIIDGNSFLVEQNGLWGWCDKNGKIIINPQFILALPFLDNKMSVVKSGGKFGFIDKSGKFIVNPQFDFALPFNNKSSIVKSSGKYGFIDRKGKFTVNPQFDNVSDDLADFLLGIASDYVASSPFKDKSFFTYMNSANQYNSLILSLQVNRQYDKYLVNESDQWRLFLEEGMLYSINMMSDDFYASLELFDSKENFILENDNSGGRYDARIFYIPSTSGVYILECASQFGEEGNYSIKVQVIPDRTLGINSTVRETLSRNSPILNSRSSQIWSVYLDESSFYQIDLMSSDFDAYLTLLLNGEVIYEDDDGGSGYDSRIRLRPPVSGYYTIYASAYSGLGQYSLLVQNR